jgi:tetratricopeptide (TPR) repeat protein
MNFLIKLPFQSETMKHFLNLIGLMFFFIFMMSNLIYAQKKNQMADESNQIDLISISQKSEKDIQDLVVEGTALLEKNEYEKAILIFEQAVAQSPTVPIALMIAKLYSKQMVNCQQAILAWENAIEICRKQSCDLLGDILSRKKQYVDKCGPMIILDSNVPSDVFENEKALGSTPLEIRLLYGSHFIEFRPKNAQYKPKNLRLSISEHLTHQRFNVELEQKSIFQSIFSSNANANASPTQNHVSPTNTNDPTIFLLFENTPEFSKKAKLFTTITTSTFGLLGGISLFLSIQKNNNALSLYKEGQIKIDQDPENQVNILKDFQNAINYAEDQRDFYRTLSYVAISMSVIALISRIYLSVRSPYRNQTQSNLSSPSSPSSLNSLSYSHEISNAPSTIQFGLNHISISF